LHFFSDSAKKTGYGAVVYIRLVNKEGKIHVALLFEKSRVLPLKPVSKTPRLELIALVLSAKIADQIKMQLSSKISKKISKVCYWTDFTIVLQNLRNLSARLPTFEANRYQQIMIEPLFEIRITFQLTRIRLTSHLEV
jgi:hypothetical protein